MTLEDVHKLLNFYINKAQGSYLTHPEIDDMLHVWQISLYRDLHAKLGTSEDIVNSLLPFEERLNYDGTMTTDGILQLPDNYFDIIYMHGYPVVGGRTLTEHVDFPNKDELSDRINSQLIPMSSTSPFAELIGKGRIQLYPKVPQVGLAVYYREPVKPEFKYTLISGRVVVYDTSSTQLEWSDKDVNTIIIRALTGVGINISAEDVQNWANNKAGQNENGPLKT